MTVRLPDSIEVNIPEVPDSFLFWMEDPGDEWDDVLAHLTEAFEGSRAAAQLEQPILYVVPNDALLGRSGPGAAMVAAGLVSAARTAAVEGSRKGWTANVVAYDTDSDPQTVIDTAGAIIESGAITGDVVHVGPGHLGKALP